MMQVNITERSLADIMKNLMRMIGEGIEAYNPENCFILFLLCVSKSSLIMGQSNIYEVHYSNSIHIFN